MAMLLGALQQIESFHLVFLRLLESRLNRAIWVVKGGVNLRLWFGSRRYSEDLDIDLLRGTSHALEQKVDKLLASRPYRDLIASQGLELTRVTKPKQTETTQRWKFEVRAGGSLNPLHTRVEFSRRGAQGAEYRPEPVAAEVLRPYGLPAPTVNHYTARSAIHQKVLALAGRSEVQARDVFDLDHLLRTSRAEIRPLPIAVRAALPVAVERALDLRFEAFKAQVVPYLDAEYQELYGTRDAWDRMCELVTERLSELT